MPTAPGNTTLVYRFAVGPLGSPLRVVKDFDLGDKFEWTPMVEGTYRVRVDARDSLTGELSAAEALYNVSSRVSGTTPVVSSTPHPLVFLYSAPPCRLLGFMRVGFRPEDSGHWQFTPWQLCRPAKSMNFYLAGMQPATNYVAQDMVFFAGQTQAGPQLPYTTGSPEVTFPIFIIRDPPDSQTSLTESVLLQSPIWTGVGGDQLTFPVATDLNGRVLWYYPNHEALWQPGSYLLRPLPGGTMLLVVNDPVRAQGLREIDLAGNTLRETNAAQVSEQLILLGKDRIGGFSHDAIRLPNGHTLVIAYVERILSDVQGPGPIDILGDMVIDLDENWQVTWAWNSFDHLDVTRAAILGETCSSQLAKCPPLRLDSTANDWTHANALDYLPADGNVLLSLRNQDWVIKIAYQDGAGSGQILWRLGKGGDFTFVSPDPYPWFSHQHDVDLEGAGMLLFDNGNTRCEVMPKPCHSRGQLLRLDESARAVTLELNADLGNQAPHWGSAEKLSNGNYHFLLAGLSPGTYSQSIELLPNGATTFVLETRAAVYRSFRMQSLYDPEPDVLATPEVAIYLPVIVR